LAQLLHKFSGAMDYEAREGESLDALVLRLQGLLQERDARIQKQDARIVELLADRGVADDIVGPDAHEDAEVPNGDAPNKDLTPTSVPKFPSAPTRSISRVSQDDGAIHRVFSTASALTSSAMSMHVVNTFLTVTKQRARNRRNQRIASAPPSLGPLLIEQLGLLELPADDTAPLKSQSLGVGQYDDRLPLPRQASQAQQSQSLSFGQCDDRPAFSGPESQDDVLTRLASGLESIGLSSVASGLESQGTEILLPELPERKGDGQRKNLDGVVSISAVAEMQASGIPSIGSLLHAEGRCVACAFARGHKRKCSFGFACDRCHLPHEGLSRKDLRKWNRANILNEQAPAQNASR
jgi:hypothetical protein